MQTLDVLLEEELERLGFLLEKEYNNDSISNECKLLVSRYIKNTTSVLSEDFNFIKGLTKVGERIIFTSDLDSLDETLVEKLYKFNLEGVQKIDGGDLKDLSKRHLSVLKSHLQSHAGAAAKKRAELAEEKHGSLDIQIDWVERWYNARISSADTAFKVEPLHSAYSRGFAGDAAEKRLELAEKTGEALDVQVRWAERAYYAKLFSARMTHNTDPMHTAYRYSFAGNAAKKRFELAKKIGESLEVQRRWIKRFYRAYELSAKISVDIEPLHAAYAYGFKGEAAWILFKITRDTSWLEKCYNANKLSAEMIVDTDPKRAAHSSSFAGDAAKILYRETGELRWLQEAIKYYEKFFDYYDSNPGQIIEEIASRIRLDVDFLKRQERIISHL